MSTPQLSSALAPWEVIRFKENPIITPYMMGNADENINGPTLIKVPDWVQGRLARYYLYFAHHEGSYIRMAYADDLRGPWQIYDQQILPTSSLPWKPDHVASPDVIIDEEKKEFRLYFHSPVEPMITTSDPDYYKKVLTIKQSTFVSVSGDGLHFTLAKPEEIAVFYLRVWQWKGMYYGLGRGGIPLYRSRDGFTFEEIPGPFSADKEEFQYIRHVCIMVNDDLLTVFYTRIFDAPERIFMVRIHMTEQWQDWQVDGVPRLVLAPETGYEGANLPRVPTQLGSTYGFENGVRDPFIYREDGRVYLLYSVVGERGIAIAELR